jgi:RNA polymerase sigma-70 factor (ECF subfamily)
MNDQVKDPPAVCDRELLERHTWGDPDAFAEVVRRHRDRMWAVALRTLGDQEEAADALQDAFVSAYHAAGRFRGDATVTTWLHRIVVNACLDRLRRRSIRPGVPAGDATGATTVDPAAAQELDVGQALQRIPVDQRAAVVLVDVMGYAIDDAASVLGIPPGTVKSRVARGRARLGPMLRHARDHADPTEEGPIGDRPRGVPADGSGR